VVKSFNLYRYPISISKVKYWSSYGPGHPAPFDKAIDYAVPVGTEVMAPLDGEVVTVVDRHNKYGPELKYAKFGNFVQIKHANGEFSDLIHLAKGSVTVKVGDKVKQGVIAKTGLSGFMTAPHLHWMVFRHVNNVDGFESLTHRLI
jgi:murein DD-endopeptidase MepM/ murein hydrolase activator NlpD